MWNHIWLMLSWIMLYVSSRKHQMNYLCFLGGGGEWDLYMQYLKCLTTEVLISYLYLILSNLFYPFNE